MRRHLAVLSLLAVALLPQGAEAAAVYVSPTGSDANDGSLAHPFQTIAKCAAVLVAGDTCFIAPGTYREFVAPAASGKAGNPISFEAQDPANPPVLAGTRPLSGFTPWQGSIWKAPVTGPVSALFVDRTRMILAQDPNLASGDPLHPSWYHATADGGPASIVDDVHLTQPAGAWDGAKIYVLGGLGWSADQRDVSGYDPVSHQITFAPIDFGQFYSVDGDSVYFLYNKLELLDSPGEWYADADAGLAYLWPSDGRDPNTHVVEVDGANAGFDLSSSSYVRVSGVQIIDGEIRLDNAVGCSIEDVRLLYPRDEVHVGGSDNQILHSEVAHADGRCVYLGGTRNALRSSHIHHCDAIGQYRELVKLAGPANVIADNSLHDTGRDGVGTLRSGIDGSIVEHNAIFNTGLIAKDCGAFYTYEANGGGTVLRYNIVHDVWPAPTTEYGPDVRLGFGIYFDDGCTNYVAHHNVTYATAGFGLFLHEPSTQMTVVNNTLIGNGGGTAPPLGEAPGSGGPDATGSTVINNLAVAYDNRDWCIGLNPAVPAYDHNGYFRASGTTYNSQGVEPTGVVGEPHFVDAGNSDFALSSGSPFIDRGAVVPGITDGFTGAAPDIGAYELGATEQPGPRGEVGPVVFDAGAPVLDGGAPAPDAGASPQDAGPLVDAGLPTSDAGLVVADAGAPGHDGGANPSGSAHGDGGAGSTRRSMVRGGCGSVGGLGVTPIALLALGIAARRRRRSARQSSSSSTRDSACPGRPST